MAQIAGISSSAGTRPSSHTVLSTRKPRPDDSASKNQLRLSVIQPTTTSAHLPIGILLPLISSAAWLSQSMASPFPLRGDAAGPVPGPADQGSSARQSQFLLHRRQSVAAIEGGDTGQPLVEHVGMGL